MITGTSLIAGKEVGLAYCYATEIAFTKYTGVSIHQLDAENPEHILYVIISAIVAYCQANGTEIGVKDEDIIYGASPKEITNALKVIFSLRNEWYEIPAEDITSEEKEESQEKKD